MDLVVDANVIFAALIKDSFSYHLLFNDGFSLFTPDYVLTELENHQEEIIGKTDRTAEDFFQLIRIFKRRITLVHPEELMKYVEEAEKITPDPNDMAYFALALKLDCPIWSNEKKLKEQNKVKVYFTHELAKL